MYVVAYTGSASQPDRIELSYAFTDDDLLVLLAVELELPVLPEDMYDMDGNLTVGHTKDMFLDYVDELVASGETTKKDLINSMLKTLEKEFVGDGTYPCTSVTIAKDTILLLSVY